MLMTRLFSTVILCLALHLTWGQEKKEMTKTDYEKAWTEVSQFEDQGLPESALTRTNEIYAAAKEEKNAGQLVKAIVHLLKFADAKEEDAFVKNIYRVREEIKTTSFPVKPLLHSMLAEMYWQYYSENRWKFHERSETQNVEGADIETWSLGKIILETQQQYSLSLHDSEKSKNTPIDLFVEVLHQGNKKGRAYRPTLYDFLAHRALAFYTNEEPEITQPAQTFSLNNPDFFSDAKTFLELSLETSDTLSMKYRAISILQSLTAFHLNDNDPAPFIEIELQRLQFVRTHYAPQDKDERFLHALETLHEKVKTHPVSAMIEYHRAVVYQQQAEQYKPLQDDAHKWDRKKAFEICSAVKTRFPDSDGAILCDQIQHTINAKTINALIESVNVPAQPFRSLIRYKNFTTLHYRIIKTNRNEVQQQRSKTEKVPYDQKEAQFIDYFVKKEPIKSGKFTLPDDGDFQQHSIEVKLDPLPEGEYMILYSHLPDFSFTTNGLAYAFTTISNIAYIHRTAKDGTTEFHVLHRQTGAPLGNVKADVYTSEYNYQKRTYDLKKITSVISDTNGYFKIPYQQKNQRQHFIVDFTLRNDFVSTRSIDSQYGYNNGTVYQYKREPQQTRQQTYFFLDRAIYRPGQTIYFKGIVVTTNGKTSEIQPGYTTTIALFDVNRQNKGEVKVTTNEYGTFHGSFTAPSGGLTGAMQLKNLDNSGAAHFSVEEYKRPKFEVNFQPVKGSFRLNETITVEGNAQAYSGASIDNANVTYSVIRRTNFPLWCWYKWGYYPHSPEIAITSGVTKTDTQGKFNIPFIAIPDETVDPSSDPTFSYTIHANVTDINGESHDSYTNIEVGYKSLRVNVPMENINKLDTVHTNKKISIETQNLAGEFEPTKGTIKIYSLKAPSRVFRNRLWDQPDRQLYKREEYYAFFPHDLYADESNKFKWERSEVVVTLNFNTAEKRHFQLEQVHEWKNGDYVLVITATDKDGKPVQEMSYFSVFSPAAKNIPVAEVDYFNGLKLSGEPGEKATFLTGTAAGTINVLYEIEQDGEILSHERFSLDNEQKLTTILLREEHRGNLGIHYTFVKHNRFYHRDFTIEVPFSNKVLDISFETFRDKLQPGEKEEWKIKIKGPKGEKLAAEMVATLYDQSLDQFRQHSWFANFYNSFYAQLSWQSVNGFEENNFITHVGEWNTSAKGIPVQPDFDSFNWFGYSFYNTYRVQEFAMEEVAISDKTRMAKKDVSANIAMAASAPAASDGTWTPKNMDSPEPEKETIKQDFSDVKTRTNFNETAFFYPDLRTNEAGEIVISFTIPEALTRWKMLGFAHTKELVSGFVSNQLVTQKDLMIVPNQPRFFREHDKMIFTAKVTSLREQPMLGEARLEFFDALTGKPVDAALKNTDNIKYFSLDAKASQAVSWSIEIPEGLQALTYRIVAKSGTFSDGEEMMIPVVTNRMLVTETLPLPIRGKQTKTFRFEKMVSNKSKTLRHQNFTLEFTSNPAWYAVQALPYLMEYPYECVEQTFSRYYANSIASHIANGNPKIKQVFETWKNIQPDALLSNLEKNQELKTALLEETPWVLQAKDESQRKRMLGILFDLNRMANEQEKSLGKIIKAQTSNGGFPWFPGMPEDRYITQHIIAGMGHLDVMGVESVKSNDALQRMIKLAVDYMDSEITRDYKRLKDLASEKTVKLEDKNITQLHFHYLYARSYFKEIQIAKSSQEAFDYFLQQAKKYWLESSLYTEGMACLALHRYGETGVTSAMIKSFNERALKSEEMGMYWKTTSGYYWYQAPIETQALMIEVYEEVARDTEAVEALKVWLLKRKQTQDWKTTKATVEATYALLRRGTDLLSTTNDVSIKVGKNLIDMQGQDEGKPEAGTGYFKKTWSAGEIAPGMGVIEVNKNTDGVAWGAAYWQYFEQLDKITPAETALKIKKELFVEQLTTRGKVITPITNEELKVGDLIKVRIEIRSDRNLEYVHLKDMRASGFEPVSTLSAYRYQDGLHYYENTRDLSTNFFMGYLPKGTYVFEYDLRVGQRGDFSNGVTTIQCMYAPEFTSHSQGVRVQVK